MTDPHLIIDEIRTFLQSSDQTLTDRIKEVARQYTAACQEANQRLSRCAEYLRKGLRTEAIHLAQAEPQLLDLVSMLDFPERSKWEEMATFYDLPVPPALKLDTAAAINEAYADDQPLEELRYSLSAADVHVVSLGEKMVGIIHPCKVYGAMAVSRPVLFFGPRPSHISDLLDQHNFGVHVSHGNDSSAIAAISYLRQLSQAERDAMGRRAQQVLQQNLSQEMLCGQLCDGLELVLGV